MKVYIGRYHKDHTKERKIRVEIHDYDTWSLDDTLAHIIYPALLKFKENNNHIFADNKEEMMACEDDEKWKEYEARSEEILDEMIWSFKQISEGKELNLDDYRIGELKECYFTPVEGHPELTQWNNDTEYDWERYHKDSDEFYGKIQRGLALFAKHYMALWT